MKKSLVLDVDTGGDDAIAIMLAGLHPRIDLKAVTTVRGNFDIQHTTDNSLRVLDHIGRSDVKVYRGASRPLVRTDFPVPRAVKWDNHVNVQTIQVPATDRKEEAQSACSFLTEFFASPEAKDVSLVAVGCLTNIASAVIADENFAKNVSELVIMGGGHTLGNSTPAAEFNIWGDPEAAETVFSAGFRRIVLLPLDATHTAPITRADCLEFESFGTPAGQAASVIIQKRIDGYTAHQPLENADTATVHDAICVTYLVEPDVITSSKHLPVMVETQGLYTTGRTVMDFSNRSGKAPNCHVAFTCDYTIFKRLLVEAFSRKH